MSDVIKVPYSFRDIVMVKLFREKIWKEIAQTLLFGMIILHLEWAKTAEFFQVFQKEILKCFS